MTKLNDDIARQWNVVRGIDPKKDAFNNIRKPLGIKPPNYGTKNADAARPPVYAASGKAQSYYDKAGGPATQLDANAAKRAAGYASGIDESMGIKAPIDTRAAVRTATMGELDRSAHEQDIAQAHRVARQGAGGSALELSLQNRTGQQLAGNRAQAEAGIQQDFANAQATYDQQRRAAALDAGNRNAGLSMEQRRIDMELGNQAQGADQFNYEANQLFPYQTRQANEMAYLRSLEAKKANRLSAIMGGINAGANVAGAVAGGI